MKHLAALLLAFGAVAAAQVPYERIRNSHREPGNWLTYSGNLLGHRYSPLDEIRAENVGRLKVAWVHQMRAEEAFETSPIVVDGILYITEPPGTVRALDGRTGRTLWRYERPVPKDPRLCCSRVNRGLAILDDQLFYGSIDAHLIALDMRSGRVRWDVEMASYKLGYSSSGAPLAVKDKVITGIAGGEFGIRGFLDAYDARTGKRLWRFHTIPGPGEPGNDTWAGESWKTGAAPTWVTGSYDPESDTVFWGTGNPGPDWNGDVRLGDNLYSCTLLALDATTGKKKWHFQFTPHDVNDWDATQTPVVLDGIYQGQPRKLIVSANRNAFYYVIDRETGKFLVGKSYAKQTWASGLDESGRPMRLPNTSPSENGTLVYPSLAGGTNWYSPSYSPLTKLFYVNVKEQGAYYYKGEAKYVPGALFNGGGQREMHEEEGYGAVRAIEAVTGDVKWEFRIHSPPASGLMATAGGLVFGGANEGDFFALDARTGKPLWRFQTGGTVIANPISYLCDGKQYVAIPAGSSLFTFALDR